MDGSAGHPQACSQIGRSTMPKSRVQQSIRWSLAAIILVTVTATANAGAFLRGCAARDMQILMLIEDRDGKSAVSAEKLREAMLSMMHARIICHEGRVMD